MTIGSVVIDPTKMHELVGRTALEVARPHYLDKAGNPRTSCR